MLPTYFCLSPLRMTESIIVWWILNIQNVSAVGTGRGYFLLGFLFPLSWTCREYLMKGNLHLLTMFHFLNLIIGTRSPIWILTSFKTGFISVVTRKCIFNTMFQKMHREHTQKKSLALKQIQLKKYLHIYIYVMLVTSLKENNKKKINHLYIKEVFLFLTSGNMLVMDAFLLRGH